MDVGDHDAALAYQRRALLHDPLNSNTRQNLGVILSAHGRVDEALATYRTLEDSNPDLDPDVQVDIPWLLVLLGRHEEAASEAMRLPEGEFRDHALAFLNRVPAHRKEADAVLRRFEEHEEAVRADVPDHRLADGRRLAVNYAFRGLHEEAIDALTNTSAALASSAGVDWHLWRLRHELENSPFLEPLRADPRWPDLVAATPAGPDPGRRDGSSPIAGSSSPDRARRASAETSGPP
jgi:hypothetical protein